jgi:hypothetical protein
VSRTVEPVWSGRGGGGRHAAFPFRCPQSPPGVPPGLCVLFSSPNRLRGGVPATQLHIGDLVLPETGPARRITLHRLKLDRNPPKGNVESCRASAHRPSSKQHPRSPCWPPGQGWARRAPRTSGVGASSTRTPRA